MQTERRQLDSTQLSSDSHMFRADSSAAADNTLAARIVDSRSRWCNPAGAAAGNRPARRTALHAAGRRIACIGRTAVGRIDVTVVEASLRQDRARHALRLHRTGIIRIVILPCIL